MTALILISAAIIIFLVLLQVRDGGLNVTLTGTLQAPIEKRGSAKTLHIATIIASCVFVGACIASFLF